MTQLSTKLPFDQLLTKWASALNPLLALPILQGNLISNVALIANKPQPINHLLAKMPQGWFLLDNIADTVVWRTQPYSLSSITLEASANTTISFWIF